MPQELSRTLNIEHDVEPRNDIVPVKPNLPANHIDLSDADEDYSKVRDTLQDLLDTSQDAINDMVDIAKESDKARDYEVLSGLIKTASDTANKLIMLQQKVLDLKKNNMVKQNIGKPSFGNAQQVNVDQIFVGTPADLIRAMKAADKNVG